MQFYERRKGTRFKRAYSMFSRKLVCLGAPFLVAILSMPTLHGQTTAQLSGAVTDSTGALIPGATVTLVNEATKDIRVVTTNNDGLFTFPALLPATYTLKVTAKNFEPKNLTGIELHGGDQRAVPALTLATGSETQTVTVQAI